jgi:hypothetical protein
LSFRRIGLANREPWQMVVQSGHSEVSANC